MHAALRQNATISLIFREFSAEFLIIRVAGQ
jgi:hypothetical protein